MNVLVDATKPGRFYVIDRQEISGVEHVGIWIGEGVPIFPLRAPTVLEPGWYEWKIDPDGFAVIHPAE